jgi:hypothetical protein
MAHDLIGPATQHEARHITAGFAATTRNALDHSYVQHVNHHTCPDRPHFAAGSAGHIRVPPSSATSIVVA